MTVEEPIAADEFAVRMSAFAPFEKKPRIAVAVSGGPDSLALMLLAREWCGNRGGRLFAVTVDHGLRQEAAAEARQVAAWAQRLRIAHEIVRWTGPRPRGDVQAAARSARYRLLDEFCARHSILHLVVAHHREDQAETFLLRLARGSGLDGLAGMSAAVERPVCRLLRPLLAIPSARLRATLAARGQKWLEDPSNLNPAFARVRLRHSRSVLAREGLTADRLAATAGHLARARDALEAGLAAVLARAAVPHPAGHIMLDPRSLTEGPEELGLRALAAVLVAVSGSEFSPRLERLAGLYETIRAGLSKGRTLGGCRIVPKRGMLLVCRETAAVAPPLALKPGEIALWDGRIRVSLPKDAPKGVSIGALAGDAVGGAPPFPEVIRATLPALRDRNGVLAVYGLNHVREGSLASDAMLLRTTRPATRTGVKVV